MKTYVLYHGNCPDGFGAALAAWLKLGNDATYIPVNYGNPVPDMDPGSKVFIVDFSYPRNVLLDLSRRMARTVVLDHHATAQADLAGIELHGDDSEVIFDMEKSGAVLACEYFHEEVPEFFLYLQDRDLWRFALPFSREISCALRSYPFDFRTWAEFLSTEGIDRLAAEGEACLRLTMQQVNAMAKHAAWMRFFPGIKGCDTGRLEPVADLGRATLLSEGRWVAPVANATVFFSEVAQRLLELHPEARFAAYYSVRSDGRRQFGLRSGPNFDCSEVAKAFGGGGHRQAAGFVL